MPISCRLIDEIVKQQPVLTVVGVGTMPRIAFILFSFVGVLPLQKPHGTLSDTKRLRPRSFSSPLQTELLEHASSLISYSTAYVCCLLCRLSCLHLFLFLRLLLTLTLLVPFKLCFQLVKARYKPTGLLITTFTVSFAAPVVVAVVVAIMPTTIPAIVVSHCIEAISIQRPLNIKSTILRRT